MVRPALIALPALLISCDASGPIHVAWPTLDLDVAFLVNHDPIQNTAEVRAGPLSIREGSLLGDTPQYTTSLSTDQTLALIGFGTESLNGLVEGTDTSKLDSFDLVTAPANDMCEAERVVRDFGAVTRQLRQLDPIVHLISAEEPQFRAASFSDAPWLGALDLAIPLGAQACPKAPSQLVPFGASEQLLRDALGPDASADLTTLRDAWQIDPNRVVAMSRNGVFLFERGQPFVDDGRHLLIPPPGEMSEVYLLGLHAVPMSQPPTFVVGALWDLRAALHVYRVTPDGLEFVKTATRASSRMERLTIAEDGRVVVVGQEDLLLLAPSIDGPFHESRQVPTGAQMNSVVATGSPDEPFIIGTADASLWIGDPFAGSSGGMVEEHMLDSLVDFPSVLDLAGRTKPDGELDVWATVVPARLLHRVSPGQWEEVSLGVTEEAALCAAPANECGLHALESVGRLGFGRGSELNLLSKDCPAVFQFEPEGLCLRPIPLVSPVERVDDEPIRSFRRGEHGMIAVGTDGLVIEVIDAPR